MLDLGPHVERVIDAPAPRRPAGLGDEQRHHQRLEHAASPARDDLHPSIRVVPLEDLDAQVGAGLALRRLPLLLRTTSRPPGAADAIIMLGGKLAARDADVAGDPRLGVHQPVEGAERLVVRPVDAVQLARMLDGVGRIVGLVEEAEIHRLQERLGPLPQRRPGVAHHDQGGREPAVVHRRDQRADRLAVARRGLQGGSGAGIEPVEEEAMDALQACQRRERPLEAPPGLGRFDDLQLLGGQGAPEVGGDVRRRGLLRRLPRAVVAADRSPSAGSPPGRAMASNDFQVSRA